MEKHPTPAISGVFEVGLGGPKSYAWTNREGGENSTALVIFKPLGTII